MLKHIETAITNVLKDMRQNGDSKNAFEISKILNEMQNSTPKNIQVRIKTVYGEERIYPICEKAKLFTQLVKQKCLTREDVDVIKALGYSIEVIQEVNSL